MQTLTTYRIEREIQKDLRRFQKERLLQGDTVFKDTLCIFVCRKWTQILRKIWIWKYEKGFRVQIFFFLFLKMRKHGLEKKNNLNVIHNGRPCVRTKDLNCCKGFFNTKIKLTINQSQSALKFQIQIHDDPVRHYFLPLHLFRYALKTELICSHDVFVPPFFHTTG